MNRFFKKLPLIYKLLLIGLIPFCFFLYLTVQVYREKTEKLSLFSNYKIYIKESADISGLIDALQEERKFSFDYAMTRSMQNQLKLQRPRTDALIQKLLSNDDPSLKGFTEYTNLSRLPGIRKQIDSFLAKPNEVMHFYSNTVFRLNTLNTIPPANTAYLKPIYQDLVSHKILSEMITYLGIIRSNIYNVLHTRQYMIETMVGTVGTHDIYNSYEAELLVKATPEILKKYKEVRENSALTPTVGYIDTLFTRFAFDSSYTAAAWWQVSEEGVNELRNFQMTIWEGLDNTLDDLYTRVETSRTRALVYLALALICVIVVVAYIVYIISRSLGNLQRAAEKIANGETGIKVSAESRDAVGSLAGSISRIDRTNQALADAANAIGRGNFDIPVHPRSENDILGNAIVYMKDDLQQYSRKMEQLVALRTEELARSNEDLQQFAHVASHDLKEPLRKIITFSNILSEQYKDELSEKSRIYLEKIEGASRRMSDMVEAVLAYSTVAGNAQSPEPVDLDMVIEGVQNDLELAIIQKGARVNYEKLPRVKGVPLLLQQLFYNLVNNALKFSKPAVSPVIAIESETIKKMTYSDSGQEKIVKPFFHITVKDNGIGFDPQHAEQMFNAFSRLNARNKYEGTGLGLALCRKIVQRHGGEIYAEGEEGKGATLHILLPV